MHGEAARWPASLPDAERPTAPACWLVRFGNRWIGPISLELVERGLEAGVIPQGAQAAHVERGKWHPVEQLFIGQTATGDDSGVRAIPNRPCPAPPDTLPCGPPEPSGTGNEDDPESLIDTLPSAPRVAEAETLLSTTLVSRAADPTPAAPSAPPAPAAPPDAWTAAPSHPEGPVEIPKRGFWASLFG